MSGTPPYPRHEFVWNPEGTLARWENNQPNRYARVFGYDEEGRLVRIERDYGTGSLQVAYAYGYNSDGVKVLERKYITSQHWLEYRFVGCGTECTRNSLSLYARERVGGQGSGWRRAEEYAPFPTGLMYRVPQSENEPSLTFVLSAIENGYVVHYPGGHMIVSYHTDSDGTQVGGLALPVCAEKRDWTAGCVPYPVVPAPEMPPYVPPPVYLPPYEPPRTNPGDYESPLPGPWDDFKEAVDCSSNTLDADRLCRPSPEFEDEYQIWCENHPFCVGNSLCCHQRCYDYNENGQIIAIRLTDQSHHTMLVNYEYNSDGALVSINDSSWEFLLSCGLACRDMPLRIYGRRVGSSYWQTLTVSLIDGRGQLASLHKTFTDENTTVDVILWVHYGMWNLAAITSQSGSIVTRSGEPGHCERLKEELLSLLPSGCKTPLGIFPCALPPEDCRRFNDLLYRFCYECGNASSFMLDCHRFAEWYYKYSGCKPGAPFPGLASSFPQLCQAIPLPHSPSETSSHSLTLQR